MKTNKKNILILLFSTLIIIICFAYFLFYRYPAKEENRITKTPQALPMMIPPQIEVKPLSGGLSPLKTETIKTEKKASLIVFDKKYEIAIGRDNSVYKTMDNLQKLEDFSFSYKEYPSLGIFINKINDIEGSRGKYWIYYVNGQEAQVGVSKYILKDGDIISWELK